jgi:release factor glutamine methyltransferase
MQRAVRLLPIPGVFRPISDSWLLARVVRDEIERAGERPRVLDVCTGSGVVGVTAARAGAEVTAIDVSCRAVAAAWLNARINRVRVRPLRGSLLEPVLDESFDVIAANPPYVPSERANPRGAERAWAAGPDGRRLLDRLLAEAPERLRPGGALLVVHSDLIGADTTLARLEAAGLEADVAASERGPLGPLMRDLARRGQLAADEEEVLVLRGRRPTSCRRAAPPAPAGSSRSDPRTPSPTAPWGPAATGRSRSA